MAGLDKSTSVKGQDEVLRDIASTANEAISASTAQWVLIIVIGISVLVALATLSSQRIIAKKRAAYDYMVVVKSDRSYLNNQRTFVELAQANQLESILKATTSHGIEEREAVRNYLNFFELLCVSIELHIVDEDVCKAYLHSTLLKRWNDASVLIEKIKKESVSGAGQSTYKHFRSVAERWEKQPNCEHQDGWYHGVRRLLVELFRL